MKMTIKFFGPLGRYRIEGQKLGPTLKIKVIKI